MQIKMCFEHYFLHIAFKKKTKLRAIQYAKLQKKNKVAYKKK